VDDFVFDARAAQGCLVGAGGCRGEAEDAHNGCSQDRGLGGCPAAADRGGCPELRGTSVAAR
jgi:hypothetical protein